MHSIRFYLNLHFMLIHVHDNSTENDEIKMNTIVSKKYLYQYLIGQNICKW